MSYSLLGTYDVSKVVLAIAQDTLLYAGRVLPKWCDKVIFDIACEHDGIQHITIKGQGGALYSCIYFKSGEITASLCSQNKLMGGYLVDYRGRDNAIEIAKFGRYIKKESTVKRDFADVFTRCHQLIDAMGYLAVWSGYVISENLWDRKDILQEHEAIKFVKDFVSMDVPVYGVNTKTEFKKFYD